MKERIYKLKESKAIKTLLSLSLAFVLLLSGMKPLEVSASNVSMASYDDLVKDADAYFRCRFINISSGSDIGALEGIQLLFVYPKVEVDFEKRAVFCDDRVEMSSSGVFFWAKVQKSNFDSSVWENVATPTVYVLIEDNYSGTSQWALGSTYTLGLQPTTGADNIQSSFTNMYHNIGRNVQYEFDLLDAGGDIPIYYYDRMADTYTVLYDAVKTYGNATVEQWNEFASNTRDVIGYKYASANGVDWSGWIWKEVRFNKDVYPYWDTDENGVRRLMVFVPFSGTEYMTKDLGFYDNHGVYDYYKHTIEYTDEYVLQPYIWYEDYYPNVDESDKNYCVMELPYAVEYKDGYAISEKMQIEVYANKEDAVLAYQLDYDVMPTPTPNPVISPQPSPEPLPPTDDSESMGFVDFIKQFENLFNASGNLWKITYYCFAFLPQQILWCLSSAVQIFLAVMVIKWIRE